MITMRHETAERLLKIIAQTKIETMSTPQIEALLGVRRSCANVYVAQLVKEGVFFVHRHAIRRSASREESKVRCAEYKLNSNDDVVQRFVERMNAVLRTNVSKREAPKDRLPAPDPLLAMFFSMAVV